MIFALTCLTNIVQIVDFPTLCESVTLMWLGMTALIAVWRFAVAEIFLQFH